MRSRNILLSKARALLCNCNVRFIHIFCAIQTGFCLIQFEFQPTEWNMKIAYICFSTSRARDGGIKRLQLFRSVGNINKRRELMIELKIKGHRTRCLVHQWLSLQLCGVYKKSRALTYILNTNKNCQRFALKEKHGKSFLLMFIEKIENLWMNKIFQISCLIFFRYHWSFANL